jgi:hypothetical protein
MIYEKTIFWIWDVDISIHDQSCGGGNSNGGAQDPVDSAKAINKVNLLKKMLRFGKSSKRRHDGS